MILANTIKDPRHVLELYAEGLGAPSIGRILKTKVHTIEKFLKDQGVMRDRVTGVRLAMLRMRGMK